MRWMEDASDEEGWEPPCHMDGDALVIDCRDCRYVPVPGSRECMGCMVSTMCSHGGAARIILRTGKDTEVSGESGRAVKEAAALRRWAMPTNPSKGRCAKCPMSRERLVDVAWSEFPRKNTRAALDALDTGERGGDDCMRCVERSRRALTQMDLRLDALLDRMGSL